MPDENIPDGSLDEELPEENGADESADGTGGEIGGEADAPPDGDGAVGADEAEGEGDIAVDTGEAPEEAAEEAMPAEEDFDKIVNDGDMDEDDAEAAMLKMLEEDGGDMSDAGGDEFPDLSGVQMEQPEANPVEFQQLSPSSGQSSTSRNIDMLLDVKMPISIELGRTEMPISDLLSLGPGSVVELNKLAGEPVDLLVNNVVIAKGEVVVVDENFGVRVTLLMSPEERLKSMAQQ